jgi:hypothetical protein
LLRLALVDGQDAPALESRLKIPSTREGAALMRRMDGAAYG